MLNEIEAYLNRTGMAETRFGRLAVKDPRLIGDLRQGRCLGPAIRSRIASFIEERRA